ncbi:hypothetical protein PGTDC60_0378 [Porphyromonas gingivalis TDC60]|nr:hypothetical protein PGTDC60_0378 [Porphyromonas gingivalis TDC60]
MYYTFVLRMNNVNDRAPTAPSNLRIETLHVADSGCKSKTFFRIGKINRLFFQG